MALFRNAKRTLGMSLYGARQTVAVAYSTGGSKGVAISQSTHVTAPNFAFLGLFSRRFSSQAPSSSEQMNLIKQLRERTSAPIKDVKASLVECNWDIGTEYSRFCFYLNIMFFPHPISF